MAQEWCERLGKAFGNKAQNQHGIFAMALEKYMGRQYDEFVRYLKVNSDLFGLDEKDEEDEF